MSSGVGEHFTTQHLSGEITSDVVDKELFLDVYDCNSQITSSKFE